MAKKSDLIFIDQVEMIATDKLKFWENNPRNNEMAVEPIANSIKQYGMLVPILINKKNEVIAGNTRLKACLMLGMEKVPCVKADHLTKEQQQMFNIADNKLHELSSWDQDILKNILEEFNNTYKGEFDAGLIGFQQAEMDLIFNGWNSNAQRIGDIKSDDSVAPGKIVIQCKQEEEETIRAELQTFINEMSWGEVVIK